MSTIKRVPTYRKNLQFLAPLDQTQVGVAVPKYRTTILETRMANESLRAKKQNQEIKGEEKHSETSNVTPKI